MHVKERGNEKDRPYRSSHYLKSNSAIRVSEMSR